MSNFDPDAHLILQTANGDIRMDRHNSILFTFLGDLAMYNHVFITSDEGDDEGIMGTYLFRQNPVFGQIAGYMLQNEFPGVINQLDVPQCDRDAFDRVVSQETHDLDHFPDDWS